MPKGVFVRKKRAKNKNTLTGRAVLLEAGKIHAAIIKICGEEGKPATVLLNKLKDYYKAKSK